MTTLKLTILLIINLMLSACEDKERVSVSKAPTDLQTLSVALKVYRFACGQYPNEDLGLLVLIRKGDDECDSRPDAYLSYIPNDPWGNPYIYRNPGANQFELYTLGKDGRVGGKGESSDIRLAVRKIVKDEQGIVQRSSVNSVYKLMHQARSNGSIRLRVAFGTEWSTKDAKKHAENTQRYKSIRKSVISDLGPRLIKGVRNNYRGLPWIIITVDDIGLLQLIGDPRILYIESTDLSNPSKEELKELLD